MQEPTTFPWPEVLSGEIRGRTEADLADMCGKPHEVAGDIRIYRFGQDVPEGTLGDPRSVTVQLWLDEGAVAHAWLRLVFAEDLDYQEILW